MKRIFTLLLTALLCLGLCACGGSKTAEPSPTAEPTAEVVATPAQTPEAQPTETPAAEPTDFEKAEACIGGSVEELYAAIGQPLNCDYASSCLGDGEDGLLKYDGFSVYTYREGDTERVDNVLAD